MVRFTPRHLVFYFLTTLVFGVTLLGLSRIKSNESATSKSLEYTDDLVNKLYNENADSVNVKPEVVDPHDKEQEIAEYLKSEESHGDIDDIVRLTDEEIRNQLEMIKAKQKEKEVTNGKTSHERNGDSVDGTLLDNDNRIRKDSPPDYQPWVQYELDRVSPDTNAYPRENATLFTLCRNKELYEILDSIQQLEVRFNSKHNYDWVFMNEEPFTQEFIDLTSNMVSGRARYGLIPHDHWSYPEYVDQEQAKSVRESKKWSTITYGSSESYRHMCRYNSLFFHKHPIMEQYQYFWRVEPHVSYQCDILKDPFKTLVEKDLMYGFTISMRELPNTIETLWSTSKLYFDQPEIKSQLPENNLLQFVSDDDGDSYNLCHFWSNFEVVNLDLYRSELYDGYVNHLDQAGGFFYERWGDAPVHSIAASLLLEKDQIWLFQNISYSHTIAHTCPLNDVYLKEARCTCDPSNEWTMRSQSSCNIKFLDASEQEKNADFDKYYTAIQNRLAEEEDMRVKQRQLRMETARRQAAVRKARAQERKQLKKKQDAERKERQRQRKGDHQDGN